MDAKRQLAGKDLDARKEWKQKEKGTAEDEIVRWHHQVNGHEFEQVQERAKDREAWHDAVCWVTKSQAGLSDWTVATKAIEK